MALKDMFKNTAADPTLGLANSQTVQNIQSNLNLGAVVDNMNPNMMADRIKANAIANVIAYEGGNDTFIWKHPVEDFNIGSQLIVHESQEAIFFMNGEALDLFGPGRHTLSTQNLPIVGKFFAAAMGGETPFHCEVYFINKTEQLAVKWGTDSKLEYVEPTFGFPIQIGASGEMALRVEDSRKLLVKVVGTERGITQQSFVLKMRAFLLTRIKNHLALYIKREKINIFEIDEHLLTISGALQEVFSQDFIDYGISLEKFFVTTIVKPEEDGHYKKFKELHFRQYADIAEANLRQKKAVIDQETEAKRMTIEAKGLAEKREIEGYTYRDERGFDVAERMASNEAVGQMANVGIGMGMMSGVGGTVGGVVGGMMHDTMSTMVAGAKQQQHAQQPTQGTAQQPVGAAACMPCGNPLPPGAKFCLECGAKVAAADENKAVCPSCSAETPKGRFCLECGSPMMKKCGGCGIDIPPGGKFCLECGQKLD